MFIPIEEIAAAIFFTAPVSTILVLVFALFLVVAALIECFSYPDAELQLDNVGQEASEANEEQEII